jgi:hypothetical protein
MTLLLSIQIQCKSGLILAFYCRRVNEKWLFLTISRYYFRNVINAIIYSCRFNTKFIDLVELYKIMLSSSGSHDIILLSLFNKFSKFIKFKLIQYTLYGIWFNTWIPMFTSTLLNFYTGLVLLWICKMDLSHSEFVKWTCPTLHLELSIVILRDFYIRIVKLGSQQYRTMSSSTLLLKMLFWQCDLITDFDKNRNW